MKLPLYRVLSFGLCGALVVATQSGCEITSEDRQIISDAVDPTHPTAPPAPTIPVAQIPACHVERFTQPAAVVTEKLDLLLVVDTSGSLNAERGKLADAMDAFVRALPSTVDYRIGIMPAHGPHSKWAGKLFRRNKNEAWILDSKAMSLATIQSELRDRLTKQSEIPNDSKSDGGEMGIYSLLRALDTDRVTLARSQGFFRTDASLVPVLMSDENDICTAVYPVGVIPVPDPQGAEKKAKQNDCGGVTNQALALKLAAHMGSRPYVTAGVIYNSLATVPKVDENEFGYGYFEFIQMTNGITIDMADANYRTGMEALGNRAAVKMNLKSDFTLAHGGLSAASLVVAVDGIEVPYTLNDSGGAAQVVLGSLGLPGSVVDITYCVAGADTIAPDLVSTSPSNGGMISHDLRPVSGVASEQLSSATVSVAGAAPVALTLSADRLSFSGSADFGAPGLKNLVWTLVDMAGNRRKLTTSVTVSPDVTAPLIAGGPDSAILTNQILFTAPITVSDESSVLTSVFLNGLKIQETSAISFTLSATLTEGMNAIRIESTDAVGLKSVRELGLVSLDTVAPVILGLSPLDGSTVGNTSVHVSGTASEDLSYVAINGAPGSFGADSRSFSSHLSAVAEGPFSISIVIADLAGNQSTQSLSVSISLKVLNLNLVSVFPTPDGLKLSIHGAAGATKPNASVSAVASLFNRANTIARSDGSFDLPLSFFSVATVTAEDLVSGRTDTGQVSYNIDTQLAGTVKDTSGTPLNGVTVSISSAGISTKTDATGTFHFQEPVVGDQLLVVDGSTAILPQGIQKKFSSTRISISIGLSQSNVLERPIYLAPVRLDGSATRVTTQSGGTVIDSVNAQGVRLIIPGDVAAFPGGVTTADISIARVPAAFSTIEIPEFVVPEEVVCLEPSGTSFSSRIPIELPNTEALPPGVELVILSMNSSKGIWELDGVVKVDDTGERLVSKPGMGISHFSTIVAVPLGPKVSTFGSSDQPGADTFQAAMSTSIQLPTYKIFGESVGPQLVYKSSWARPTALISNSFDIPREELEFSDSLGDGYGHLYRKEVEESLSAWYEPTQVTAKFQTTGIDGQPIVFNGPPNKVTLSFAAELISDENGDFLSSGEYPTLAHYEVKLRQMTIRTRTEREWEFWGRPKVSQTRSVETRELEQAFPSDLTGNIPVLNKMRSPVGKGWKIAAEQRILNPENSRILIEESNGGISYYAINNSIETLVHESTEEGDRYDFSAVNFSSWPRFLISRTRTFPNSNTTRPVHELEYLDQGTPVLLKEWSLGSTVGGSTNTRSFFSFPLPQCDYSNNNFEQLPVPTSLLKLSSNSLGFLDGNRSAVFQLDAGNQSGAQLVGGRQITPVYWTDGSTLNDIANTACRSPQANGAFYTSNQSPYGDLQCQASWGTISPISFADCRALAGSFGKIFTTSPAEDGSLPAGFNGPTDMISGLESATLVVVDKGNSRVRKINLNSNTISTIAGNGNISDSGDGGLATAAGIFHPYGAVYDAGGNLYITSEGGQVRKVDTTGRISTLVGGINSTPGDNLPAHRVRLVGPTHMVVDNTRGYLYISETGAHKVRRLDLSTNVITTVAGIGISGFSGEGGPALGANLSSPRQLGLDGQGNLIINDSGNRRIRRVIFQNPSSGGSTFASLALDHSSLIKNSDGTWTRKYRNGDQVNFDLLGRQVNARDLIGRTTTYEYNSDGQLTFVTDPTNRKTQFTYSSGSLASITDPAGRTSNFTIVGGFLAGVTFPDGSSRTFEYNDRGMIRSSIDENGLKTKYRYNDWNRLTGITDTNGKVTEVSDSGSKTLGNGTSTTDPMRFKSFGLGPDQVADAVTDPQGNQVRSVKDSKGYVSLVDDGEGNLVKITRDDKGRPTEAVRENQTKTTFEYDAETGDLLSQSDTSTGIKIESTFDSAGRLLTSKNGRGFVSSNEYNALGQLLKKKDPLNNIVTYEYGVTDNPYHLLTAVISPRGKRFEHGYDSSGNKISSKSPSGLITNYEYDPAGNVKKITSPGNRVYEFHYSLRNQLEWVKDPLGRKTQYRYHPGGQLKEIEDPVGNLISLGYDSLFRLKTRTDQLGFKTTFDYDDFGNVISQIDPSGHETKYQYDSKNRLIKTTRDDDVIDTTYSTRGRLKTIANSSSSYSFEHDDIDRVIGTTSNQGLGLVNPWGTSTTYSWDKNSNLSHFSESNFSTQMDFEYDAGDRVTKVINSKGEPFTYSYDDAAGKLTQSRLGGQTLVEFDDDGRLKKLGHKSGSVELNSFSYIRDEITGDIKQITSAYQTKDLLFDAAGQIKRATNSEAPALPAGLQLEEFSYDEIYNRTSDSRGSYAYDDLKQRVKSDYRYIYYYDDNGNLTSRQAKSYHGLIEGEVTQFSYSSANQLKWVKHFPSGQSGQQPTLEVYFVYDAFGNRIQKKVVNHLDLQKSFTRRFIYERGNIVAETNENNVVLAKYTHSGQIEDDVLAVDVTPDGVSAGIAKHAKSYFYLKDAIGSITDIVDSSGTHLQHQVFSAFGELLAVRAPSGTDMTSSTREVSTSYAYAGRELDSETGLYYFRARYYDPTAGRFLQKDPHPGALSLPMTVVNSYVFGGNNPFQNRDPSGASFLGDLLVGIVAGIAAVFSAGLVVGLIGAVKLGAVGSVLVGAVSGAVGGAIAGGLTGGLVSVAEGGSFAAGFAKGAIKGAITGFVAGGIAGYLAWDKAANAVTNAEVTSKGTQSSETVDASSDTLQTSQSAQSRAPAGSMGASGKGVASKLDYGTNYGPMQAEDWVFQFADPNVIAQRLGGMYSNCRSLGLEIAWSHPASWSPGQFNYYGSCVNQLAGVIFP